MDINNCSQIQLTVIDNVIKGGRGSGKSKTTAIYIIRTLLKYNKSNCVCVRQNYNTLFDSCYQDLIWACNKLHVTHMFDFQKSPLRIIKKDTKQVILFKGFNDPLSLTSMSVVTGYLNLCWIEEAYQLRSEEDFDKLDYSIRGELEEGYFFKIILTFNPYSDRHFLYRKFWAEDNPNALCWTTTYKQNPFVGGDFNKLMEQMKVNNPRKYRVLGLGEWGVAEGLIYDNWRVDSIDLSKLDNKDKLVLCNGGDFGFNDPTTFIRSAVDIDNKKIYIYEEYWNQFMTVDDMEELLKKHKLDKVQFIVDNARPEIIEQLNRKGCKLRACKKGKDSVVTGIAFIQDFEIIVDESCEHTIEELSLYAWDTDKLGNTLDKPIDESNHLLDS